MTLGESELSELVLEVSKDWCNTAYLFYKHHQVPGLKKNSEVTYSGEY